MISDGMMCQIRDLSAELLNIGWYVLNRTNSREKFEQLLEAVDQGKSQKY
jgi:hypothetical protein